MAHPRFAAGLPEDQEGGCTSGVGGVFGEPPLFWTIKEASMRLEGAEQGAAIIAANLVQRSGPPLPSESEAAPDEGLNRRLLGVP